MLDQWYYWGGSDVLGPFSGTQLAQLATDGKVVPTDIVWREGVERGVQAHTVKNLFSPVAAVATPAVEAPTLPDAVEVPQEVQKPAAGQWWGAAGQPAGRARAVAGKGTTIVGQDGTTVKFRMKCTTCGQEDRSWKSMPITRGTTRASFYCPKCRRQQHVEIMGYLN